MELMSSHVTSAGASADRHNWPFCVIAAMCRIESRLRMSFVGSHLSWRENQSCEHVQVLASESGWPHPPNCKVAVEDLQHRADDHGRLELRNKIGLDVAPEAL